MGLLVNSNPAKIRPTSHPSDREAWPPDCARRSHV